MRTKPSTSRKIAGANKNRTPKRTKFLVPQPKKKKKNGEGQSRSGPVHLQGLCMDTLLPTFV